MPEIYLFEIGFVWFLLCLVFVLFCLSVCLSVGRSGDVD